MGSTATITAGNFEMTPVRVKWKKNGGSTFIDLGGTDGTVKVAINFKKFPLKADQIGTEPFDHKVGGLEVKVTTVLGEFLNKDNWLIAFPHATEVPGGTGFAGKTAMDFGTNLGDSSYAKAGSLLLHPLSQDDAVLDYDLNFDKACAMAVSDVVYGPDKQIGLSVEWFIYPNLATMHYFRFGDAALIP